MRRRREQGKASEVSMDHVGLVHCTKSSFLFNGSFIVAGGQKKVIRTGIFFPCGLCVCRLYSPR